MKKILAFLLLGALLTAFVSCVGRMPAETTPPTSTVPPITTAPAVTPPEPIPLSTAKQKELLSALSEQMTLSGAFSVTGELLLLYGDGASTVLSVDGNAFYGESLCIASTASLRRMLDGTSEELRAELYERDGRAWLLLERQGQTPTLRCVTSQELYADLTAQVSAYAASWQSALDLLAEYRSALDLTLLLKRCDVRASDLLALLRDACALCAEGARVLGIELSFSVDAAADEGDSARALAFLCEDAVGLGEAYRLTLTPGSILTLVEELFREAEGHLDTTVAALLDGYLEEGKSATLYRRLALIKGSDTVASALDQLELVLANEGLDPNGAYAIAAALLDRSMTASMTAERLKAVLEENKNRCVDDFLNMMSPSLTYAQILSNLHSILSMPPSSLYSAFGGTGELSEVVASARERATTVCAAISAELILDLDTEMRVESLSVSLSLIPPLSALLPQGKDCVSASLSCTLTRRDAVFPLPTDGIASHPDFRE